MTPTTAVMAAPTTSVAVPVVDAAPLTLAPDPQQVTVGSNLDEIAVDPWLWCLGPDPSTCSDGSAPDPLPGLVTAGEVLVSFPVDGWYVRAELCHGGAAPCLDSEAAELDPVGPDQWRLDVPDVAAMWGITVHAEGPDGLVSLSFATLPGDWG